MAWFKRYTLKGYYLSLPSDIDVSDFGRVGTNPDINMRLSTFYQKLGEYLEKHGEGHVDGSLGLLEWISGDADADFKKYDLNGLYVYLPPDVEPRNLLDITSLTMLPDDLRSVYHWLVRYLQTYVDSYYGELSGYAQWVFTGVWQEFDVHGKKIISQAAVIREPTTQEQLEQQAQNEVLLDILAGQITTLHSGLNALENRVNNIAVNMVLKEDLEDTKKEVAANTGSIIRAHSSVAGHTDWINEVRRTGKLRDAELASSVKKLEEKVNKLTNFLDMLMKAVVLDEAEKMDEGIRQRINDMIAENHYK